MGRIVTEYDLYSQEGQVVWQEICFNVVCVEARADPPGSSWVNKGMKPRHPPKFLPIVVFVRT